MSGVKDIIRKAYQAQIREGGYNSELIRALRVHERVPVFIDNMAKEFSTQKGMKFNRDQIEFAAREMTKVFVIMVERQAEERLMSPLAKAMRKAKVDAEETFRKEAEALEKKGADNVFETIKGQVDTQVTIITDPL